MKPTHFLPFLFALFFSAIAMGQPPTMPEGTAGEDFNRLTTDGQKDGPWVRVYEDGSIYYLGQFDKGTPIDTFYFYYETGKVMSIVNHIEGQEYLHATTFNEQGLKISSGHYRESKKNGVPEKMKDGPWIFYENGKVVSEEEFNMNVLHGTYKVYYPNGKLAEEAIYKNGLKHGPWKQYFEDGKTRAEGNAANGDYDGKGTFYHPNGMILIEGRYVRGVKDGRWGKYMSSGETEVITEYKLGTVVTETRKNGKFMDYYDNGIPKCEYEYVDGKKDGPFTEWFEKGEFVRIPLDDPQPGGGIQFKEELQGRQISCEGDYMDGHLEGEITYYNEDGRIIKIEIYEDGELISTQEK